MGSAFKHILIILTGLSAFFSATITAFAQEHVAPLRYNGLLNARVNPHHGAGKRTSGSLSMPFFEDFTGYSAFPDPTKWVDSEAYINNTMGVGLISRGVATLDALDKNGIPYDTSSNTDYRYADSLTSMPINLSYSSTVPGDSLYLSFFYQPGGNGFYPLLGDSLIIYFKNRFGDYVKVDSFAGINPDSGFNPVFTEVMIPITDSLYFFDSFQFRFVNIAAQGWADAVWNIDYIRLNQFRSYSDTMVNDVAIISNPTPLLNDYTSMPYSQFLANITGELATTVWDSVRNDSTFTQNPNYTLKVFDTTAGGSVLLSPPASAFFNINGYQSLQLAASAAIPSASVVTYAPNTTVSWETLCYFTGSPFTGPTVNDTIASQQVFSNYLAYDDGSAEKSYYLDMDISGAIPGELQVEFHLNHPDTLRGLAIYFGRQVPPPDYKVFSIMVYNSLKSIHGSYSDNLLREQDYYVPGYIDTVNHFWVYRLDTPVVLPAGEFYAGVLCPAYSNSDSLYFGLDVNRVGDTHRYYRVAGTGEPWNISQISGAVMIRPLLGYDITSSSVQGMEKRSDHINVSPNPASKQVTVFFPSEGASRFILWSPNGQVARSGVLSSGQCLDVATLVPGTYILDILDPQEKHTYSKIVKE